MKIRFLYWWSPQQLAQIASRIEQALLDWHKAWGIAAPHDAAVFCELAHENPVEIQKRSEPCNDSEKINESISWCVLCEEAVWVRCQHSPALSILLALFGAQAIRTTDPNALTATTPTEPQTNVIASQLANAAWRDWYQKLRELFQAEAFQTANRRPIQPQQSEKPTQPDKQSEPPLHDLQSWSGAVRLSVHCAGCEMTLHISASAICALLGVAHPFVGNGSNGESNKEHGYECDRIPTPPLVSIEQALQHHPLSLNVMLNQAEVTLGTLQALRPNDVLCLPHPLQQPLLLKTDNGAALCSAYLGQRQTRRAVALTLSEMTSE